MEQIACVALAEIGNPKPPIDLAPLARIFDCDIQFTYLNGPEGYTVRTGTGYHIYIATDLEGDPQTVHRRQRWTLAHELSHVIAHWNLPWNTTKTLDRVSRGLLNILEVEANWCASRLLIPDYCFETLEDLIPSYLAEKCDVNFTPASKRIEHLSWRVRNRLQALIPVPLERAAAYLFFKDTGSFSS
ncbi:ImmA/IrrE family metallo-endopeptidase [Alicyclobacillus sendaiensis]|uniref:ImmA/IrrE family metallo-endopeptidase n=1 Tax=Alicyclobacillus sendaiensis TaxID=192387 RepID=UPI0009F839E7|nr:ImmA/IrrE family metallo-endopeptidase [Alicyclobacillus sendaiensis]